MRGQMGGAETRPGVHAVVESRAEVLHAWDSRSAARWQSPGSIRRDLFQYTRHSGAFRGRGGAQQPAAFGLRQLRVARIDQSEPEREDTEEDKGQITHAPAQSLKIQHFPA